MKRSCRTDQPRVTFDVDLELECEAGGSYLRDSSANFQHIVEPSRRFELHRRASEHRVNAERKQILPLEAYGAEVFSPGHVVVGEVVAVEHDRLEIGIGESNSNL